MEILNLKKEFPLCLCVMVITEKGQELTMPFDVYLTAAYSSGDAVLGAINKVMEEKMTGVIPNKEYSVVLKKAFKVEEILEKINTVAGVVVQSAPTDPPPLPAVIPAEEKPKEYTSENYEHLAMLLSDYLKSPAGEWLTVKGWECYKK